MSCLNQFTTLQISGPDAERFLQGQFSNNINELADGMASYGACCNAKGRMVANFLIANIKGCYWLILPTDSAALLQQHLQKYKVFFKADIVDMDEDYQLQFDCNEGTTLSVERAAEQIIIQLATHCRIIVSPRQDDQKATPSSAWQGQRLSAGIHFITAKQSEQWIPQQLNWHLLAGVSFNKGCYTGQEIVARMQYLGKSKKNMGLYQSDAPLSVGEQLFDANGKAIAEILDQQQDDDGKLLVLAVVSAETLPDTLFADQNSQFSLTLQNLPYTVEKTE